MALLHLHQNVARELPAHLRLLGLFVLVVAQLALPLEAGHVLHALINEALHHVAGMHVDGAERDELLPVVLGELTIDDVNQVAELVNLLVKGGLQTWSQQSLSSHHLVG